MSDFKRLIPGSKLESSGFIFKILDFRFQIPGALEMLELTREFGFPKDPVRNQAGHRAELEPFEDA